MLISISSNRGYRRLTWHWRARWIYFYIISEISRRAEASYCCCCCQSLYLRKFIRINLLFPLHHIIRSYRRREFARIIRRVNCLKWNFRIKTVLHRKICSLQKWQLCTWIRICGYIRWGRIKCCLIYLWEGFILRSSLFVSNNWRCIIWLWKTILHIRLNHIFLNLRILLVFPLNHLRFIILI